MSPRTSIVLAALACCVFARADVKVGDTFPALGAAGVVDLGGGAPPATAGKVVLVDFWASWCAPCKASFPVMAKIHTDFAARGFLIAAVSVDDKPAAATDRKSTRLNSSHVSEFRMPSSA